WSACLFAFVYLLYPPLHGANLYDFHYLPLGIFFLWLTVFLVESGRTRWAVLSVIVTLSIREDVAAGLGILGAYLLLSGRRPLAGLVLAIVGVTYFVVMKLVIMPLKLGDDSFVYMFKDLLPKGETGFSGVLKTVFSNPVFTLNSLLTQEKLLYVVQLAVPLAFIPWRRPIGWLCTLPGFFFTLLSTGYSPLVQISFQYTANWISFIFIAGLANLAFVGKAAFPGDTLGPIRRRSWMMTIAAMTLCTSYQYGAIMQLNTARGGFGPYIFGSTKQDQTNYAKLKRLIRRVPPNAKIVSSENIVPHIANRADSYTMRIGAFDAEYLLGLLPANLDEARTMKQALDGAFGVIEIDMPFVLARRGYPKDRNSEALQHIHP
ncbi:MAG TPA: DUF2079 domain-containing protein, partial [Polyangiaceae bacterium]|nr:DUF2079 domain-containing protein [Polyangiaceae bacterium]